jgi:pimeloyl-ACP methyl ester carboxylesterase
MAALSLALAETGPRVMIPELPGHAGGEPTDIKQAAAAVSRLIDGAGRPTAVVGHSFASMVMRLAFAETAPPSIVLVAPALDVNDALDVFGDRLGLFPWARSGLRRRLEAWDRTVWPVVSSLHPEQMPGAEILVLHDPEDPEASFSRGIELARVRSGTEVVAVPDAGHNGILSDRLAIDRIVRFLARESVPG